MKRAVLAFCVAACSSNTGDDGTLDEPLVCEPVMPRVVKVPTDDGLMLEGDLWSSGEKRGGALILLHMTPSGGNDRTNFPDAFAEELVSRGITVLNLDRRGVATDDSALKQSAYLGPDGKLDAKAGYDFLVEHPCALDASRIGLVGASNGTTTALDFALFADADPVIEIPKLLVFLTGGSYTENQFSIAEHRDVLDRIPILFVYAENEAGWSEGIQNDDPSAIWTFRSYSMSGHGTHLFESEPSSMADVITWIAERL